MSRAADLDAGFRFGRYVLMRRLGRGGMGEVWLAYDPVLQRPVAIKILRARADARAGRRERADTEARVRLQREAKLLAMVDHPHVVDVFDVGVEGERDYLAMAYVEGRTLRAWLGEATRDWRDIAQVMLTIAKGLAAVHHRGLVHRDVKPDNIMIHGRDQAVLVDFGIARDTEGQTSLADSLDSEDLIGCLPALDLERMTSDDELTVPGTVVGTPDYMAPEQADGELVDGRADQFSFCLTFERALGAAGQLPRIPGWLRRVLEVGLSDRPRDRFASMDELVARVASRLHRRCSLANWTLAVSVGALFATQTASFVLGGAQQECDANPRWARVWNERRADELTRAFVASESVIASATARGVRERLNRYGREWVEAHDQLCEAGQSRATPAVADFDQRMHCMHRRLGEVDELVAILGRGDTATVQRATKALRRLSRIEDCNSLRSGSSWSSDPSLRRRLDDLERRLARGIALFSAGRLLEARAVLEASASELSTMNQPGLLARVEIERGGIEHALDAYEDSLEHFRSAERLARVVDDATTGVIAIKSQVFMIGYRFGDRDRALALVPSANALLERGESDPISRAALLRAQGIVRQSHGDIDASIHLLRESLALIESELGPVSDRSSQLLESLGASLSMKRQFGRAEAYFRRALELRISEDGPDHERTLGARGNLGVLFDFAASPIRAGDIHREVLAHSERLHGANAAQSIRFRNNLVNTTLSTGEYGTAATQLSLLLERYAADGRENTSRAVRVACRLAVVRAHLGDREGARAALELATRGPGGGLRPHDVLSPRGVADVARAMLLLGDLPSYRDFVGAEVIANASTSASDGHRDFWYDMGLYLLAHGELERASEFFVAAARDSDQQFGPGGHEAARLGLPLVRVHLRAGRPRAALDRSQAIVTTLEHKLGAQHPGLLEALILRARSHLALDDRVAARRDVIWGRSIADPEHHAPSLLAELESLEG